MAFKLIKKLRYQFWLNKVIMERYHIVENINIK